MGRVGRDVSSNDPTDAGPSARSSGRPVSRRLRRSPFTVRPNPFTVRPNPFTVRRNPSTVRPNPFTVRRNPFTVRRSPFTVRRETRRFPVRCAPVAYARPQTMVPTAIGRGR
ncbi:hypothetical protein GCM10009624_11050 [Gordonia sinesedis]